jgi:hypothetical protein
MRAVIGKSRRVAVEGGAMIEWPPTERLPAHEFDLAAGPSHAERSALFGVHLARQVDFDRAWRSRDGRR